MSDDALQYVGIDLGGTSIQAGLIDEHGKVLASDKRKTKADLGQEKVIERIEGLITRMLKAEDVDIKDIQAIGIGAPGPADPETGIVHRAVNLGWTQVPLGKILHKAFDRPVIVDNDVNVGTWGEFKVGAGKDFDEMFGIFVGTGIGGGLVLNKKLYRGHFLSAGEIGHTIINPDASLGRRTVENLASRTNIVDQLQSLIQSSHESVLSELTDGDLTSIRSKLLAKAYDEQDALTLQVIHDAARYVGAAVANVVTLLSLPKVVVGGGLTEAIGKPWVKLIEHAFREFVFPEEIAGEVSIVAAKLGDDAGIVGAAMLAHEHA